MGVEGYFLPKWREGNRGYHLCLFAQNAKGYENIKQQKKETTFRPQHQNHPTVANLSILQPDRNS